MSRTQVITICSRLREITTSLSLSLKLSDLQDKTRAFHWHCYYSRSNQFTRKCTAIDVRKNLCCPISLHEFVMCRWLFSSYPSTYTNSPKTHIFSHEIDILIQIVLYAAERHKKTKGQHSNVKAQLGNYRYVSRWRSIAFEW